MLLSMSIARMAMKAIGIPIGRGDGLRPARSSRSRKMTHTAATIRLSSNKVHSGWNGTPDERRTVIHGTISVPSGRPGLSSSILALTLAMTVERVLTEARMTMPKPPRLRQFNSRCCAAPPAPARPAPRRGPAPACRHRP